MSRTMLVLLVILTAALIFFSYCPSKHLFLLDPSGRILMAIPVRTGEQFEITFIHSSELEPWENIFTISESGELILTEMRVPSTGPGVPSVLEKGWSVDIEKGFIIYRNINKRYRDIRFIVSSISPHYLTIGDKKINLVDTAGNWAEITLTVEEEIRIY